MAATVGSLLLDAIKSSGMIGKVQSRVMQNPAMQAGVAAGQKAAGIGAMTATAGPGGGGGIAKQLTSPLSGMMKTFMPGIGKMMPNIGKVFKQTIGLPGKLLSKGLGMLGINLSLSTLLRQSQLFTGILGALFQILGGFVDVILAPFMPLLVKVVQKLGAQIPKIREFAQKAYVWLSDNFFPLVRRAATWLWDKISAGVEWVKTFGPQIQETLGTIWDVIQEVAGGTGDLLKSVFGWMKENVWPVLKVLGETIWQLIQFTWDWIKDTLWPGIKTAFDGIKTIIEGTLAWLKDTFLPLFKDVYTWFLDKIGGFFIWFVNFVITNILQKMIPTIQSIFTQIVDTLLNSILKPLWASLEPFIKWWLEEWAKQFTWIWSMVDTKILPFVKSILDDFVPPVTRVIDAYMKEISPYLTEYFQLMREIAEALMDILMPLIKWILKGLWFFLEPILIAIIKIIALMFKWIIIPLMKLMLWILRLPFTWKQSIVDPIMEGFQWIKEKFEDVMFFLKKSPQLYIQGLLKGVARMLSGLAGLNIDLPWPLGDIGLGFFNDLSKNLTQRADAIKGSVDADRARMLMGRHGFSGELPYGGGQGGTNITINNISKEGMLDDTKNFVVDADEQRAIENMQNRDSDFGSYSSLQSGLAI